VAAFVLAHLVPGGTASDAGALVGVPLVLGLYLLVGRLVHLAELEPVYELIGRRARRQPGLV
jgi:hypothetical protein